MIAIHNLTQLISKAKLLYKVCQLDITESGVDDAGDPFVRIGNGTIFFGSKIPSRAPRYIHLYSLMPYRIKRVLKKECIIVAMDIVIRYVEQGLMYGGPKKQSRYSVKPGDKVSEMGAYQGFFSIKLAQLTGENGKTIAIEPHPENYRLLKKNIEANALKNVYPVNIGVWHTTDKLTFQKRYGDSQSSSAMNVYEAGETATVPVDSLDNIYSSCEVIPEDFLVIQLNGAEANALDGLTTFKPRNLSIAARYDTDNIDSAELIKEKLEKRGYFVEIISNDFVFASLTTHP